jgi:two-component system sensor histidine kinase KdpD
MVPVALSTISSSDAVQMLALAASGRPVGLLALTGVPPERAVRELLPILANHLALAVERSQLRDRAARAEVLEEIDRLRRALVGAVSHDLRTPLATIKVASSTLVASSPSLAATDIAELHGLIDMQTDRLARLVNNLLDMTRIQAGVLEVRRQLQAVHDLIMDAVVGIRPSLGDRQVMVDVTGDLPLVNVDRALIGQVLGNLIENADRHAPPGTPVTVVGGLDDGGQITISVLDQGPGVPADQQEAVFETFVGFDTGGRSGLGLAIAKAFVEAHGDRIWVEDAPGGGAQFRFTLQSSIIESEIERPVATSHGD